MQEDEHLYTVWGYVERNALRAGLAGRAEGWRWGSLWHRVRGSPGVPLSAGPLPLPAGWAEEVNRAQTEGELAALWRSVVRGTPFGNAGWQAATAKALRLESTLRPRGRPKKAEQ